MKITTRTKRTYCIEHDDVELEVQHEPIDGSVLFHRDGDKIVVAYLVDDNDGSGNPMKDYDCQGKLYTRSRQQLITDNDGEFYRALGLDSYGDVDIDQIFYLDGERTSLRGLALTKVKEETPPSELADFDEDTFDEEAETLADSLYQQHWRAIGGPYVVPVSVYDVSVKPTTWDGDRYRLPDGVWVADAGAIENLTWQGKVPTQDDVVQYAKGVLDEYSMWANGEVYGCVVETFEENNGYWTAVKDEDLDHSCWGFIGRDNAKEVLQSEFFDPAVKSL